MQKRGYIVDYIFRVLIIIVLVLGFFPFSNEIHFYPKGSGEIISLSCKTDNGTVTNKDSLKVDSSIHKDSGLTLVTTDDYYANFTYAGIPTGTLTGNAQDGEYLSRITLDAFETSAMIFSLFCISFALLLHLYRVLALKINASTIKKTPSMENG